MNHTTRTFPRRSQRPWEGVCVHYRRPLSQRIGDVLLATVIGVCLAAALCHWWSS